MSSAGREPEGPPLLVSDADRDMAVQRLREAYAEGRVSHEEMDERLHRILTARTHHDLVPALASLPEEHAGTPSTIAAARGRIRRRGAWRVPRVLRVESAFGGVHLDLSHAVIEHPVVDIELHLGTGGAKITVPRDAIVEIEELRTVWKQPRHRTRRHPRPGGPRIRISGTMEYGRLKIRHARR
ncbi:DUF1707 domain-containing protein [Streptomyces sp. NPDC007205]|uniref:DUF1707 SHOCT-like domain-containing protein n=1 Tax=Streptomyces sp. NPDC007205 TaxID=3154316 RepID=UPI0033F0D505